MNAQTPNEYLASLPAAVEDFKKRHNERLSNVEAALQDMVDRGVIGAAAAQLNGGGAIKPVDAAYTRDFTSFIRSGDAETEIKAAQRVGLLGTIRAAMSEGTGNAGGYIAPLEWDRKVIAAQVAQSPMRRLATVVQTTVRGFSTLWSVGGWGSGWVGETASRPETTSATLEPVTFSSGEIYAMPAATQNLLEDADFPLDQWIADELGAEFGKQESIAFIAGNGTSKPSGLLTYATGGVNASAHPGGALDTVTVASASAITLDELIGFMYGLAAPYRQNAVWLMNSTTAVTLSKLKDAAGQYLWGWPYGVTLGQAPVLFGRPVEIDENMPNIAAGALPIVFGDLKSAYLINDRLGTNILRDPYTAKPYVLFYARKRVGGGVKDPRAARVLKMAAS